MTMRRYLKAEGILNVQASSKVLRNNLSSSNNPHAAAASIKDSYYI
jgi:hypothetical protein